eukprot:gene8571-11581_t
MNVIHQYDLWSTNKRQLFSKIAKRLNEQQQFLEMASLVNVWSIWRAHTDKARKLFQENEQRNRFIDVLKNSSRGSRSTMEKEILRRFILNNMSCIPKSTSFSEMDQLCNEVDWFPLVGKSILFLQGDFGNVYYMIARGSVGLFLEPSKDHEMTIAREFGSQRGQKFLGNEEDLKRLGNHILTLQQGSGFGEYAILATTNKIRSCAAVTMDDESLLLILHADTYNSVLRQHHYRQKQLSSATTLLQELPLFKHLNYSKIASIAYTMRSQSYSSQSMIAQFGAVINNVFLVVSGQVKVCAYKKPVNENESAFSKQIERRIPKLSVALLGRGQIIGDIEIQKNSRTFQFSYESGAASTEVLEMPITVYKDSISGGADTIALDAKHAIIRKSIEKINDEREERRQGRVSRAYDAMKIMMVGQSNEIKSKTELVGMLPLLLDPPTNTHKSDSLTLKSMSYSPKHSNNLKSPKGSPRNATNTFGSIGVDIPNVTRKESFAVTLQDIDTIPSFMASTYLIQQQSNKLIDKNSLLKEGLTPLKIGLNSPHKPVDSSKRSVSSPRIYLPTKSNSISPKNNNWN